MRSWVLAPFRRGVQFAAFLLMAPWLVIGWLRCPFGVPFVSCGTCSVANCPGTWLQPFAILAILAAHLARPRFFCGWLCPMGFLQDALAYPIARRLKRRRGFGRTVSRALPGLKYAGLIAVIVLVVRLNYPAERAHDYVVRSSRLLDTEAVWVAMELGLRRYGVRLALLAIAVAGGLVVARFWCRYLCPLGALLALGSRLSLGRLRLQEARCTECGACRAVCTMATEPGTAECISCYECRDVCPTGAIGVPRLRGRHDDGPSDPYRLASKGAPPGA